MSALQEWLRNHNRRMTQDAIDEALMAYIEHIEKQRDELLSVLRVISSFAHCGGLVGMDESDALVTIRQVTIPYFNADEDPSAIIARIKEKK